MAEKEEKPFNRFAEMKTMILSSLGRLPTGLVVLLTVAITVAVVSGFVMEIVKPDKISREFMPLRLERASMVAQVNPNQLQGNWIVSTPDYAMSLTFIKDRFEWQVKFSDIDEAQFYARGNFRVAGDVLVLGIRTDLGMPYDQKMPWLKYLPISFKDLNAHIILEGKTMVLDVPKSEQDLIKGQVKRIFLSERGGNLQWTKR